MFTSLNYIFIFCMLYGSLATCTATSYHLIRTNSLKSTSPIDQYIKQVDELYKNMTFSGAELSLISVMLANTTVGVAFAGFNSKTKRRYIKLNYNYLLSTYGPLYNGIATNDTATFIVMGILAHEWAHHYMGHTFSKHSRIKERNADVLAGRILFENIDKPKNNSLQRLANCLKVQVEFIDSLSDSYHLKNQQRQFLI